MPVTIAVDNAAWLRSPANWFRSGSTYVLTTKLGAYLRIKFTGTSVKLNVDVSALSGEAAGNYPVVGWTIDDGELDTAQLTNGQSQLTLATGLAAGTHEIEIVYYAANFHTIWSAGSIGLGLKITGLEIDDGASVSASASRAHKIAVAGDSITQGYYSLDVLNLVTGINPYKGFVLPLRDVLDAEIGSLAMSGTCLTFARNGIPAHYLHNDDVNSAWNKLWSGQSLDLTGLTEYWCVLGRADELSTDPDVLNLIQSTYTNWLTPLRAALGTNVRIRAFIPFSGYARSKITAGVNSYADSSGDRNVSVHDLGSAGELGLDGPIGGSDPSFYGVDSIHPNGMGFARLVGLLAESIATSRGTSKTIVSA